MAKRKPAATKPMRSSPRIVDKAPRTHEEASALVEHLRNLGKQRERINVARDKSIEQLGARIDAAKASAEARRKPIEKAAEKLAELLNDYLDANRYDLTKGGKLKSVKFALDDKAKWTDTDFVEIPEGKEQSLVDELIDDQLFHLLRMEPNKSAIAEYLRKGEELNNARRGTRSRLRFLLTGVTDRVSRILGEEKAPWTFDPPDR